MSQKKAIDITMMTGAVLGSLVLLNLLGLGLFGRLDLTRDGEFTLSEATKQTLRSLTDDVTIRAYFTKELPPPYAANSRYVHDMLEEYYTHSHGNLRYEFIDPVSEETDRDKESKKELKQDIFGRQIREETTVEKELREQGIPSVQVRVNEGDKLEVKQAYMGILIKQGDRKEVIPVVQGTDGLEYNLTTAIRRVSRGGGSAGVTIPKIAILTGHGAPDPKEKLSKLVGLMQQLYDVSFLDLAGKSEVPADLSALLVVGPQSALSEQEQQAIDQFIMSGKSVGFFLSPIAVELRKLQSDPVEHGLTSMLESYGVRIDPGQVLDIECAQLNVSQQRGFMQITQPVNYPFMPMPKALSATNPLTRGMGEAAFPFMSPLSILPGATGVKAEAVVSTSNQGWVEQPPYNLDPFYRRTAGSISGMGIYPYIVTVQGPLKSHFAQRAEAQAVTSPVAKANAEDARVLVAGGFSFITDEFFTPGNQALVSNFVDWLVRDDGLLAVRARGLASAPIDDKLSETKRNLVKYGNIVGLPVAFIAFGIFWWRRREASRAEAVL